MTNNKLLVAKNLRTYFYTARGVVRALDGVNLDIATGETLGLVGESGCGKSTMALSILRLIPTPGKIVGGEIWFENENLLEKSESEMRKIRGDRIAMIFQEPTTSLNPVYTVGDQITEVFELHQNLTREEAEEETIKILKSVRMPDPMRIMKQYPHELSGGMQQRVMIAMAISCKPKLLIADEATSSLDVTTQAKVLELMKELREDIGSSILYITHDLGVAAEMCDRVAVMYAGYIVEYADVETIFEAPKHPYTRGLIGAIPGLHKKGSRLQMIPGFVPDLINIPSGCPFHPRCSVVRGVCMNEKPQMFEMEPNHMVACHKIHQG